MKLYLHITQTDPVMVLLERYVFVCDNKLGCSFVLDNQQIKIKLIGINYI